MSEEANKVADKFNGLRKGLLEFAVLKIVSAHRVYAADILEHLNQTDLQTGEGTLYPLLSRLRRDKMVEYEWVESEAGPPRKYYALTSLGKNQLQGFESYWQHLHQTMNTLGVTQ